jgi:hypothetical protein
MYNEFTEETVAKLSNQGFERFEVLKEYIDPLSFGNGRTVVKYDNLILTFIREKGDIFLEIGGLSPDRESFYFDDIRVNRGWDSVDRTLNRDSPKSIDDILVELKNNIEEIQIAFSEEYILQTESSLRITRKNREKEFLNRLNKNAESYLNKMK